METTKRRDRWTLLVMELAVLAYRLLPLLFAEHRQNLPLVCDFAGLELAVFWLAAWASPMIGKRTGSWYDGIGLNYILWAAVWAVTQGVYRFLLLPELEAKRLPLGGELLALPVWAVYVLLCRYLDRKTAA